MARIKWQKNMELAPYCWFGCGGTAQYAYAPVSRHDLLETLESLKDEGSTPTIIGAGSNILVRDGGIDGHTILIGKNLASEEACEDQLSLKVGAGMLCANVASLAAKRSLGGLEFLIGIPGSVGGAVWMNAGCYDSEMADCLASLELWLPDRGLQVLNRHDLAMEYRKGHVPQGGVIISVTLRGNQVEESNKIKEKMRQIKQRRRASQPIIRGTGGSTFRNPHGPTQEPKAWQLIDCAGCRALQCGDAWISKEHCNFIINVGTSASDIEALGEKVRQRVKEKMKYQLEWEIHRLGNSNKESL